MKRLFNKRKATAWFLFFVFYLQLVSPVLANKLFTAGFKTIRLDNGFGIPNKTANFLSVKTVLKNFGTEHLIEKVTASKADAKKSLQNINPEQGPGPTQPEMQSFQSVNTNNMVDLFTGDFTYNIPLLDVGGYPVSIHYGSGITMDQEASWVGLGWNINAGTINRNMRGLPDDFNGTDQIVKTLSMKENRTVGVTAGGNAELLGKSVSLKKKWSDDTTKGRPTSIGFSLGVFHNSYNGWGTMTGINAGINAGTGAKGNLSGGLGITNNSQSGLDISPSFSYRMATNEKKDKGLNIGIGTNYNSRIGIQSLQMTLQSRQQENAGKSLVATNKILSSAIPDAAYISFATPSFTPGMTIPFTSKQMTYTVKVGGEVFAYHPNVFISGNFSSQYIDSADRTDSFPAYGYLYYQEAENKQKVLLDFNREKDVAYRGSTPSIAIPSYTYDIYSISGEGTGGMFRPYRGDIGMVYDHVMSTKSGSGKISVDLGFGSIFHGGVDLNKVVATTKNNPWLKDNILARYTGFKKSDSLYENVYFKNPGEKVTADQNFYDKIGDDKLVRVQLNPTTGQNDPVVNATKNLTLFNNARPIGTIALDNSAYKTQRDKRTQVISYLTAREADIVGLDRKIKSYFVNSFPGFGCLNNFKFISRVGGIRKQHHLSEISVLNSDGRKYVYGIPAYNIEQNDVTFSVDKSLGDNTTGLVSYNPANGDNSTKNALGKDNYFSKETIPPYVHSFLLSGILSSDYVDVTGDGITDDDNGNAVKFNYSQVYSSTNPLKWRAPFDLNKGSYNEGLKTYSRDDKGSYSYGMKELWYMNSIESKTMMATFVLETDSIRQDSYGVLDENGGINTSQRLYRLKEINLYTKADVLKNTLAAARPIKTVHFDYSYELCNGVPSSNATGKLTLKRVWFSYNKNEKGRLNPYVFNYTSQNPTFNNKSYDRWGNYKNPDNNPGKAGSKLTNGEYPYTLQTSVTGWDSTQASANASPWTLNQIKLPSGGVMKVSYESDDYAYVQNRRAMQMFSIAGLAQDSVSIPGNSLYRPNKTGNDFFYVFIQLNNPVANKAELTERYFDGMKKLFLKLYVKMPDSKDGGRWGGGYEQVPCFADIDDYNIKSGSGNKLVWVKLSALKGNSPLTSASLQFLRLNLPGKAYPFSEPGDKVSFGDIVGMLLSVGANLKNTVLGFDNNARKNNWCNIIDTSKSFIRLNNPDLKKLGGGLRVKSVQVFDNWVAMTSQTESSYGQSYDYSTTKLVSGSATRISSGVASYEPALGKEENPFYNPIEYVEKMALLGPTDNLYVDEPLGESFFPSPVVGYSKVTVQTVNKTKKSANGIDVSEFYTAADFPVIFENTPLDNASKQTFANPIGNFAKFDAKRYVTISQGFKVELNDMHGKMKSQSSFAQTDLLHPINYTYNYYKLDADNALKKHLSSTVATADSSTGVISNSNQMGKEIDLLIDIREQTSRTISGSLQLNVDVANYAPPLVFTPKVSMPSFETDRFRSIAVTKVINRYAILDSVVHFDKGSKISTANMVYDGETGNVLLSRTQNEFDDPVYSFNYPAYWAYSGMEGAYKNIGALFKNVKFLNGKMAYNAMSETAIQKFFESGDELLLIGKVKKGRGNEICKGEDFTGVSDTSIKIWAIDVRKAGSGSTGIFFIDKDGIAITALATSVKVIRSGKRNLQGTSAGSITSLLNPVKLINGFNRFVFDSTTKVIAANAVKFKDFWKTDSSSYRKDTVIKIGQLADIASNTFYPTAVDAVYFFHSNGTLIKSAKDSYTEIPNKNDFFSSTQSFGTSNSNSKKKYKSAMLFDNLTGINGIPKGSIIESAHLTLMPASVEHSVWHQPLNNNAFISASTGVYVADALRISPPILKTNLKDFYDNLGNSPILPVYRLQTGPTLPKLQERNDFYNSDNVDGSSNDTVRIMVQTMVDSFYKSNQKKRPSIVIDQQYNYQQDTLINTTAFAFNSRKDRSRFYATYYLPCDGGTSPVYSSTPQPGYYCYTQPRDSFICKPNLNDTLINPYRRGIWGNWQVDRVYSYFNSRKDSSLTGSSVTNIRTDGVINSFAPYWSFTTNKLAASQDSGRWVWNSEINLINSKGLELQNHDPLDRYNSAQYGYNQSLPVAVAQNSRNRQMVFDGFEDYGYTTNNCSSCPQNRFINFIAGGTLVDTISHSGLYSLRLAGNATDSVIVPVVSYATDSLQAKIIAKASSFLVSDTIVTGNGNGVTASVSNCGNHPVDNIDVNWGESPAYNCKDPNYFTVVWSGFIQPRYSELYTFSGDVDDYMVVKVNNKVISSGLLIERQATWGVYQNLAPIFLYAGQLYPITVSMGEKDGAALAHLKWQSASQGLEIVPRSQLYTTNTAPGTISISNTRLCVKLDSLKQSNIALKGFSPLQGSKIIVGAWVKEKNNNPDTVSSFRNTQMQFVFSNGSTFTIKPSGNIIEGWQRIEDTLSIPANATSVKVRLMSTNSSVPVYFDDIRIHPFNSNLKSFVYNPVNLRLMAELDENNYASFYEYDDDGTLIRIKKETEKGIKTIKETRSALLK